MIETLKLNKEFRRLYGRGKTVVTSGFVLYILPDNSTAVRYGITVSKKLGKAVCRNRAKRLLTAAIRAVAPEISRGCRMVLVARTGIFRKKSQEVAAGLRAILKEGGYIS